MAFGQMTQEEFRDLGAPEQVYVRPVLAGVLQEELKEEMPPELAAMPPTLLLFSLCGADGSRLAVMSDEATAVAAAQAHEFHIMTLH